MDITLERILSLIPRKPDGSFVHGAQKEFTTRSHISNPSAVWEWMNGRSESYKNYLWQIAAAYDVSVEWLRGETDEMRPVPAPETESSGSGLSAVANAMIDSMTRDELLDLIARATDKLRGK
jgi:transcriptional regulator with XRE-family HTH domain